MISQAGRGDVEVELVPAAAAQPITDVAAPAKQNDDIPRGIGFMVGATVLFSVSSAFAKWQVAIYPVGEVMFFRSFSSLVVCAAFVLPFTGFSVFATRRPGAHIARGLSQSISQTFSVIAFSMMPLGRRGRHQFLRPAVVGVALGLVAQGARRSGSLAGAAGGIRRRPHRHQSGRGFAPGRRTVRARQRRDVRQRHRGRARDDGDGIGDHAADVADGHDRGVPLLPASVRFPLAGAARRRDAGMQRRRQCDRASTCGPGRCIWRRRRRCRRSSISCWFGRW